MAITPNFLSQCTDEQINKGVAWANCSLIKNYFSDPEAGVTYRISSFGIVSRFDPCTNPNDIMPIAVDNRINLMSPLEHKDKWMASATQGGGNWSINDFNAANTNPYRAICEVYILMMVAK